MKKLDVRQIAKHNPRIDLKKLAESMRISDTLRRAGVTVPGDRLASPFERRRVVVTYPHEDPRTVRLPHARFSATDD
jgi:hypothetical protein